MKMAFLVPAVCGLFLQGCLFSTPAARKPAEETPFTIGDVAFPNEAAYARAFIDSGSNGRMTRFLEKCAAGGSVRLGFIGGSITAGANASSHATRYSTLFTDHVKAAFPGLEVKEINAGIGATGSRYAASRVADDLLSQSPDLVVVEFAVNDFEADSDAQIRAALEGLVRRCLKASDAPVILLFTAKGDLRNTQALHIEVGRHYGLPMVSYRDVIKPLIDSGRIEWSDVFHDDPHPNDAGHRLIAHLLSGYVKAASRTLGAGGQVPPPYLFSDLYTFAGAMKPGDSAVSVEPGEWKKVHGEGGRDAWIAPGGKAATLTLRTRKREMALGIRMHPRDTSSVSVSVDGGDAFAVRNASSFGFTRVVRVLSAESAKERTVRITHAGGPAFRIDYVLYAGEPE